MKVSEKQHTKRIFLTEQQNSFMKHFSITRMKKEKQRKTTQQTTNKVNITQQTLVKQTRKDERIKDKIIIYLSLQN